MITNYNDIRHDSKIKLFFRKLIGYLGLGFCPTCGGGDFVEYGWYPGEKSYCRACKEKNDD